VAYADQEKRFFTPKMRRLEFIERTRLDGGRKLLLVRRDDVEHLLLIGGPIDLVVESGITAEAASSQTLEESAQPESPPAEVPEKTPRLKVSGFSLASKLDAAISSSPMTPKSQSGRAEMLEPALSMQPPKEAGKDEGPSLATVQEVKAVS
jgi:hypothetical protein